MAGLVPAMTSMERCRDCLRAKYGDCGFSIGLRASLPGASHEEYIAVMNYEVATIEELSDAELDLVAAGKSLDLNNLVSVNVPVAINVGVALANQANVAVFSIATQGGSQTINMAAFALAIG
jgi:hypothetical protein